MTNSFSDKVRQGGYGVVYRGKLHEGRVAAVKVLSESKGNGEEFINEVACISGSMCTKNNRLEWTTLSEIVVGVVLDRGCNTGIVHFDIKPCNILLHEDFCPKISDFGLAKLNFGGISHKSDVYGLGMTVLELVGLLEPGEDLKRHGLVTEEEEVITNPSDRPSMNKAVEMLEGGLEALQVPPKPFLKSSFTRSIRHSSMTTTPSS
ncbi:hypothetical protein CUMW_077900 [Citrus unshiu]|nr:hypothetical protein CUMW_077900 [Citrus unshiu]